MANTVEVKLTLKGRLGQAYKKVADQIKGQNKRIQNSLKRTAKTSENSFKRMKTSAMGAKVALAAVAAFIGGRFIGAIVKAGSEVEDLTIQFKVLLGSVDAAKKRMEELEKFAQTTPFQLKEVAQASRVLETLTKGALSNGDALRMVGDSAAVAGTNFAELAVWIGRAYSGLQANRPIGEALMRLQELGLVTGDVRNRIEELQKAARGKEAWETLQNALKQNKGGMEELSKTVTGLSSTIKDQLAAVVRQMLATGLWDKLRDLLGKIVQNLNTALESGVFEKWGNRLLALTEHFDKLAMVARILFEVWAIKKIQMLVVAFSAWVTTLTRVNPLLASLTAAAVALELVLSRVEKNAREAGKGLLSFIGTPEQASRLRDLIDEYDVFVQATKNSIEAGRSASIVNFRRNKELQKLYEIQQLTNKAFAERLKNEGSGQILRVINARINLLTQEKEKVKEVEEEKTKAAQKAVKGVSGVSGGPRWLQEAESFRREQEIRDERVKALNDELAEKTRIDNEEYERKVKQRERLEQLIREQRDFEIKEAQRVAQAQREASLSTASSILGSFAQMTQGSKKYYEAYKTFAATQAVIDAIASANSSYRALAAIPVVGPGLGTAAATAALVAGLARANQIKAQQFATGGIVGGAGNRDTVPAMLTPGEVVLNRSQQQRLLNGGATQFNPTIIVNGSGDAAGTAAAVAETVEEQLKNFAEMNREQAARI